MEVCVKCGLAKWGIVHYNVNRKQQGTLLKTKAFIDKALLRQILQDR
jgi:hypothetical protein